MKNLVLLMCAASCEAFFRLGAASPRSGRRDTSAPRMELPPDVRWESYKAAVASREAFRDNPGVDTGLDLCRAAATVRGTDPDAVCEALLEIEKGMRAAAKTDGGEISRKTLEALDGAWRLVFTTGTVETQSKIGRKINYFPLRATQTFDVSSSPMRITNGIYLGNLAALKFFGTFDWLEDRRRLEFDFDAISVLGIKFDLPKGGAEELGAATGLGAKSNVKRAEEGKKAFFNWISADADIATARGGGGGLALWRRETA